MQLSSKLSVRRRRLGLALAAVLLIAGLYMLLVVLYPIASIQLVDPTDNKTIELLEQSEPDQSRLYIPKIDINVTYAVGGSEVLEQGAWWRRPDNGNPEKGGNFILSAHRFVMGLTPQQTARQSPFYNIQRLEVGDEIVVDYNSKRYTYTVNRKFAVKPDATEIEQPTAEHQLTLYSCTFGGANDGRDVFIAKLKAVDTPFDQRS